jgi:hypothetical protein
VICFGQRRRGGKWCEEGGKGGDGE